MTAFQKLGYRIFTLDGHAQNLVNPQRTPENRTGGHRKEKRNRRPKDAGHIAL
jgi:hypothetical protein